MEATIDRNVIVNNPSSIKLIKVVKLFGLYDYNIPMHDSDISKLLILYGDNGSGKTTILKCIFYLLSTIDRSGHKTALANVKFKEISITMQNGIKIGAYRESSGMGAYQIRIREKSKVVHSVLLDVENDSPSRVAVRIKDGTEEHRSYLKMLSYLSELGISIFYLSDDRKILDTISQKIERKRENISVRTAKMLLPDYILYPDTEKDKDDLTVQSALNGLTEWVTNKTISGSKTGDKNSQTIFSDIISDYINLSTSESPYKSKKSLLTELKDIDSKIGNYVKLGLVDQFDSDSIRNSIQKSTSEDQLKFLTTITSPFLESISAKLKALERVEKTISLFINTVNSYFTNKKIDFSLNKGFSLSYNGSVKGNIDFDFLSSGEKQLLLLLINTITSADKATIFIIDEPEISLNIKWQRNLIPTLLEFSQEKNVQFILATHSMELLSSNRSNVSKLENINA